MRFTSMNITQTALLNNIVSLDERFVRYTDTGKYVLRVADEEGKEEEVEVEMTPEEFAEFGGVDSREKLFVYIDMAMDSIKGKNLTEASEMVNAFLDIRNLLVTLVAEHREVTTQLLKILTHS